MMKTWCRWVMSIMLTVALVLMLPVQKQAYAEGDYGVLIEDDADLLTAEEEAKLAEVMQPITAYGHVIFKTTQNSGYSDTSSFARVYFHEKLGEGQVNGTLFVIDMQHRQLYIFSDGEVLKVITKRRAETITDNIFRMATMERYYDCAEEAFIEINKLLSGDEIAQPMKYASNAVLAIIIALLINFCIIKRVSRTRTATDQQLLQLAEIHFEGHADPPAFAYESKVYNPSSSGSGGGGGGFSGGGGGGGGGGFSGGGGGHGF